MPRPKKDRRIREYPEFLEFVSEKGSQAESVTLSLDEYETIALVDYRGLTHKECAECMDVSRTTVTEIYDSARKKLGDVIVNGKRLVIAGGPYRISRSDEQGCYNKYPGVGERKICAESLVPEKEAGVTRIAVSAEKDSVYPHFGMTPRFQIFDVRDGKVLNEMSAETGGTKRGALVGFLEEIGADIVICDCIGLRAAKNLSAAGVQLVPDVSGDIWAAVSTCINIEI